MEIEALHTGALSFMRSLGDLMRTVERVGEQEFERGKAALLEHLQGFRRSRMEHSAEILSLLERLEEHGPARMVAMIVAAEEFVTLPGGATVAEQRTLRSYELLERWRGLRGWFVGEQDSGSPWRTLNDQVVDAIRAMLAIAERLIERRSTRIHRAAVLLHLASRIAAAPPGQATAWIRLALGVRSPRHVGAPEAHELPEPGRVSWLAADPAPVVAHLRTPGARRPGGGRSARIPELAAGRAALLRRHAAEQRELGELLTRMAARRRTSISDLVQMDERELGHLLAWIRRAYESPAGPDGVRRAASTDGRVTILLREPAEIGRRTRLRAPHGTLELPDYTLEVLRR